MGENAMRRLVDALARVVISRRLAVFALIAPGQAFAQKSGQPIKVGFPMILSGPGALFGEPALRGAQMYVQEINSSGGVLGRQIEGVETHAQLEAIRFEGCTQMQGFLLSKPIPVRGRAATGVCVQSSGEPCQYCRSLSA
jgi:Periplasmic binding protein